MQTRTPRRKPLILRVVRPLDIAHELGHGVTVEVGRFEGVLLDEPARWEDYEVEAGGAVVRRNKYPYMWLPQVRTVKMEGSGWSKLMEPMVL